MYCSSAVLSQVSDVKQAMDRPSPSVVALLCLLVVASEGHGNNSTQNSENAIVAATTQQNAGNGLASSVLACPFCPPVNACFSIMEAI